MTLHELPADPSAGLYRANAHCRHGFVVPAVSAGHRVIVAADRIAAVTVEQRSDGYGIVIHGDAAPVVEPLVLAVYDDEQAAYAALCDLLARIGTDRRVVEVAQ